MADLTVTLIGGPAVLIEVGGLRFLTDPTFDPPGEYHLPYVTLHKTSRPALTPEQIGPVDAVLLSHDQHADNLDNAGRAFLKKAKRVPASRAGACPVRSCKRGESPWAVEFRDGEPNDPDPCRLSR